MSNQRTWEPAREPEDLARFFIERANAGDIDGLAALYEPNALLVGPDGRAITGREAIRAFYAQRFKDRPVLQPGEQRPALRNGDLALTSSRLVNGAVTAEVARRQPDGSWLWTIDQPAISRKEG